MRQPDKEVSRDVDFVRQNPMLVQDADKLEFVAVSVSVKYTGVPLKR